MNKITGFIDSVQWTLAESLPESENNVYFNVPDAIAIDVFQDSSQDYQYVTATSSLITTPRTDVTDGSN